jgi:hypothetical protein
MKADEATGVGGGTSAGRAEPGFAGSYAEASRASLPTQENVPNVSGNWCKSSGTHGDFSVGTPRQLSNSQSDNGVADTTC